MKSTLKIIVSHPAGLHARPAALFVHTASEYTSEILVQNLTENGASVNAKSILGILTLGVMQGHEIEITAEGDDAEKAIAGLKSLIEGNFGE